MPKKLYKDEISLILGTPLQQKVILYLLSADRNEANVLSIANAIEATHGSVSRVSKPLLDYGVFRQRWIGNSRIYTLNNESPITAELRRFFEALNALVEV